jgi:hypothetical protein
VFSADVFGSINKPNDTLWGYSYRSDAMLTAAIPDGRWAYSKAGKNTRFPDLANGFGYMRGPWNMNPSPYISRFTIAAPSLPSCSAYYDGLVMTDIMDFLAYAPFDPHAPIHGTPYDVRHALPDNDYARLRYDALIFGLRAVTYIRPRASNITSTLLSHNLYILASANLGYLMFPRCCI